jgi:hypothetical protein
VVVEWVVDPTQISFYAMQAENLGVSLAHQLKAHMDLAYSQGWFGQTAPDLFKLLLSQEQYRDLQKMFAKDIVTGADVMDRLMAQAGDTFTADDDLVMQSLGGGTQ